MTGPDQFAVSLMIDAITTEVGISRLSAVSACSWRSDYTDDHLTTEERDRDRDQASTESWCG